MGVKVEIDGVGLIELDDAFRDLTPEQQQAKINYIAGQARGGAAQAAPAQTAPAPVPENTGRGMIGTGLDALGNAGIRGIMGLRSAGATERTEQETLGSIVNRRIGADADDPRLAERMNASADELAERATASAMEAQRLYHRRSDYPMTPGAQDAMERLGAAETWGDTGRALIQDPLGTLSLAGQVAAEQTPTIAAAAAARNPAAGMAVFGSSSYLQERFGQLVPEAAAAGYDLSDPESAAAALADEQFMADQASRGRTRGAIVTAADVLTAGLASRAAPTLRGMAGQMPVQMAGGGGGEALAQLATDGEIQPGEVALEALAEAVTAPADVLALTTRWAARKRQAAPEAPDPSVSDLAEDVANGDPEAVALMQALGLDPANVDPALAQRATDRLAERRGEEAVRGQFESPRDPAGAQAEADAIAAGDMAPEAAPSFNRPRRAPLPPTLMVPPQTDDRPSRAGTLAPDMGDPGIAAGVERQRADDADLERRWGISRNLYEQGRAPDTASIPPERENTRRENMKTDAEGAFALADRRRQRFEDTAQAPDTPPTSQDPRPGGREQGRADQPVTLLRTPDGQQPVQVVTTMEDGSVIAVPMKTQTTGRRENQQQSLVLDEDQAPVRIPADRVAEVLSEGAWNPQARSAQDFTEAQQPRTRLSPDDVRPRNAGAQPGGDVTTRQVRAEQPLDGEVDNSGAQRGGPDQPRPAQYADMGRSEGLLPDGAGSNALPDPSSAFRPARNPQLRQTRGQPNPQPGPRQESAVPPSREEQSRAAQRRADMDVSERQSDPLITDDNSTLNPDLGQRPDPKEISRLRRAAGPKKPLTKMFKDMGGMNPQGRLGQELRARGITPKSAPGLFNKRGGNDFDNLPATEYDAALVNRVGEDGSGYLDPQGLADALADETNGVGPVPIYDDQAAAMEELAGYEETEAYFDRIDSDPDFRAEELNRARSEKRKQREAEPDPEPRQERQARDNADLFDQGDESQVGERQTDLEDLIAEAETLKDKSKRKAGSHPKDDGTLDAAAIAERTLAGDTKPEDTFKPLNDEQQQFLEDFFADARDVPFSNPMFNPDAYRALGLQMLAGYRRARNKLKGSTIASKASVLARLKNPLSTEASQKIADGLNYVFSTMDGRVRAAYKGAGVKSKTFETITDLTWRAPGSGNARGETVEQAQTRQINRLTVRLSNLTSHLSDDAKSRVVNALRGQRGVTLQSPDEQTAVNGLRSMFKETLAYMRDAGVDIGEVPRSYFPREYDPELVEQNRDQFLRNAAKLYREGGASSQDADAMATELYEGLVFGGDVHTHTGQSTNFFKDRKFSQRADRPASQGGLAEFMVDDLDYSMLRYITRASRRAEIARQFGDNFSRQAEMDRQMRGDGVPIHARELLWEHVRMQAGLVDPSRGPITRGLSYLHGITTMSLLEFATVTSIPEVVTPALRTGDMREVVGSLGSAMIDMARMIGSGFSSQGRSAKLQAAFELAEFTGAIAGESGLAMNIARFHGTDQVSRRQAKRLGGYFRMIQLQQFTDYTRARSMAIGSRYIMRLAKSVKGQSVLVPKGEAKSALAEFGIPEAEQAAFADYVLGMGKEVPAPGDLTGDMGNLFQGALVQFADQSIMRPTAATKPGWATKYPLGRVVFALQAFGYAFTKNIIYRQGRNAKHSVKSLASGDVLDAALYAAPVMILSSVVPILQYALGELRDEVDEALQGEEKRPMTDGAKLERAWSRSGLFGALDPYLQMVSGTRYNATVLDTAAGPVFGMWGGMLNDAVALTTKNSPETQSSERRAAGSAYDIGEGFVAAQASRIPLGGVGLAVALSMRAGKEDVLDSVAGPTKKTKRDFTPQESIFETMGRNVTGGQRPSVRLTSDNYRDIYESKRRVREFKRR